jgi:AcrR family transcriptional regulator
MKAAASVGSTAKPEGAADKTRVRPSGRPPASEGIGGRESLIVAVCDLLKHVNLKELTNGRIAERAQVDPTLIRYHFQNRAELMIAVADRITTEYEGWVAKALASGSHDAKSELYVRVGYLIEQNVKYPFFRSMLNEEVRGSELASGKALMADLTARGERDFGRLIDRGVAEGVFQPTEPLFVLMTAVGLAEAVVSMCDPRLDPNLFAAAMKTKGPARTRIPRYRNFICELLYNHLARKPDSALEPVVAPPPRRKPGAS